MKKYVSPEIEVTKVETSDIMASSSDIDTDLPVGDLMEFDPFN